MLSWSLVKLPLQDVLELVGVQTFHKFCNFVSVFCFEFRFLQHCDKEQLPLSSTICNLCWTDTANEGLRRGEATGGSDMHFSISGSGQFKNIFFGMKKIICF